MTAVGERLPESAEELRELLLRSHARIEEQDQQLKDREEIIGDQKRQILYLDEQVRLFKLRFFGRSSEKLTPEEVLQGRLFDEAEATVAAEPDPQQDEESVIVAEHRRSKRGRKPIPDSVPRVEVLHDIDEADKHCPCGAERVVIGEEISEELEFIPAQVRALHHRRLKYACPACDGESAEGERAVIIAAPPEKLIPRSISTPSLLSWIMTAKFCDHLPFARQEKQFARIGVEISRQDMSNWALSIGRAVEPLVLLLHRELLAGETAGADETPWQVHGEIGRENTAKSTLWVFCGGPPGDPLVLYHYSRTGKASVALLMLKGFKGYLQTDGSDKYAEIECEPGVIHVGCFAHARRKFMEAKKITTGESAADVALAKIKLIYKIEARVAGAKTYSRSVSRPTEGPGGTDSR